MAELTVDYLERSFHRAADRAGHCIGQLMTERNGTFADADLIQRLRFEAMFALGEASGIRNVLLQFSRLSPDIAIRAQELDVVMSDMKFGANPNL